MQMLGILRVREGNSQDLKSTRILEFLLCIAMLLSVEQECCEALTEEMGRKSLPLLLI